MTLILWRAAPFGMHVVVVFRESEAEVPIRIVVVPAECVISERIQVPFVAQCLPEAERDVVGSRTRARFDLNDIARRRIGTNQRSRKGRVDVPAPIQVNTPRLIPCKRQGESLRQTLFHG